MSNPERDIPCAQGAQRPGTNPSGIAIPPAALEAGARAMAKAGYAFSGIELTDPYTADADYWDCCTRATCLAMLSAWPGMLADGDLAPGENGPPLHLVNAIILPLPPQENSDE